MLGYRPWLAEDDVNYWIRRAKNPIKIRVCGEDLRNHIMGVLIPKFHQWMPKAELKEVRRNPQGVETLWMTRNGSTAEFMSYEQDSEKFEGWDGDFVWFDEPPTYAIYIACFRGLVDRGGKMIFTMTPLKEPWIKEKLWDKAKDKDSDIGGFVFTTFDNIGYGLTEKNVRAFEKELNEDEKTARLYGQFIHLSGRIYKEFNYTTHVIEAFKIPSNWPVYEAIDPHPRTPHAVLWVAVGPDGTKYVVDELFREGVISDIATYIKAKRTVNGYHVKSTLIDPSACTPNPVNGVNVQSEFAKNGVYTIKASKEMTAGISAVKEALELKFGKSSLYVFNNCKETIREFDYYVWDEYVGRNREKKEAPNSPRDKDDHMMECLYRIILFRPKFRSRISKLDYEDIFHPNSTTGY